MLVPKSSCQCSTDRGNICHHIHRESTPHIFRSHSIWRYHFNESVTRCTKTYSCHVIVRWLYCRVKRRPVFAGFDVYKRHPKSPAQLGVRIMSHKNLHKQIRFTQQGLCFYGSNIFCSCFQSRCPKNVIPIDETYPSFTHRVHEAGFYLPHVTLAESCLLLNVLREVPRTFSFHQIDVGALGSKYLVTSAISRDKRRCSKGRIFYGPCGLFESNVLIFKAVN